MTVVQQIKLYNKNFKNPQSSSRHLWEQMCIPSHEFKPISKIYLAQKSWKNWKPAP
jgi:hypothetical protein